MAGNDSSTKLLLHCDGSDGSTVFLDDSIGGAHGTGTGIGTAQIDTAQKKFGSGSLLLDGNSDSIWYATDANWSFAATDFTVDFQIYFSAITSRQVFVTQIKDANNYWYLDKDAAHRLQLYFYTGASAKGVYAMSAAWAPATQTWYHVAFVRSGAGAFIFIDGTAQTLVATTAFGANNVGDINVRLDVGQNGGSVGWLKGQIDEFRISNGVARWSANFTPPADAYSADTVPTGIFTPKTSYWGDL